ncbi:MAG: anaerobic ribonucleoside-triphosphate reductase activating protein [Bacilli bacterium]|nr:anaerobic ribonucleoside-triphosphate reductase activating protein [Bacilli bacterium]
MKYSAIKYFDIANGPGVRTTLFVSGCTHHCKGCFNQETWDFNHGEEFTKEVEDEIVRSMEPDYVKGLTLLGGEPMEKVNQEGLVNFVKRVHEVYPNKSIWCFTGYLYEELLEGGKQRTEYTQELLNCFDVIVDGEFIEAQKNLMLMFKGSSNQRTIDVQESLKQNKIVIRELKR